MKILLFGADGQLGTQLRTTLAALGDVLALSRQNGGDVTDADAVRRAVTQFAPDAIVNAAAYTAVDRAESEPDAAYAVNALACETLARAAQDCGAWLVHYSTDYVFDGSGTRPWREDDVPAPLSVYGASKLAGEEAIREHCERHIILRTSWVFSSTGANFVKSILAAARDRESLTVVNDQWGAPTGVHLLSDITARLLPFLDNRHAGLYHCVASGFVSRFDFTAFALACAIDCRMPIKAGPDSLRAASTSDFPSAARRPLNSRLDTTRLRETFGIELAPWQDEVRSTIACIAADAMRR
ncbi:MAG TPA: dTDP-4-dehydrorhamnose reductase [Ramlibacter sp.]|nr:dTDP-4-dehydrorhamnose reductase [Ramlibacter sp.]